jgi:hypothetical protein
MQIDPFLGAILELLLVAALYRVHKRYKRRCQCCGAMWRVSRKSERELLRVLGNGYSLVCCVITFRCLNRKCKWHQKPIETRAYSKVVRSHVALQPTLL